MSFSVNALTSAGYDLIAQATSSNPIVWIGAVASVNSYSAVEISSLDDPTDGAWGVQGGIIVAASATGTTARIIAGFTNRASETTVKTIGVVCRLASQSDADAIVVAAISDANASIRIPPTTEPAVRIEVDVNVTISATNTVTVTSSTAGSAMLSDLDRLVSCHVAGQPTTGERQTVYGIKDFQDDIYVGDDLGVALKLHGEEAGHYGFAEIVAENNEYGNIARLVFNVDSVSQIECAGDFLPYDNEEYALGSNSYRWDRVFSRQVLTDQVYVNTGIIPQGTVALGTAANFFASAYLSALHFYDTSTTNEVMAILPDDSSGYVEIDVYDDVHVNMSGFSVLAIASRFDLTANVYVTGVVSAGTVIASGGFIGVLPHLTTENKPPVGSIFLAWLTSSNGTFYATQGTSITVSASSTIKCFQAQASGTAFLKGSSFTDPGMTICLLSTVNASTPSTGAVALVMRVA